MDAKTFHRIAKALADPRRFEILQTISAGRSEVACKALLAAFEVTPATMSHHLKELATAGLIEARKEGQCMHLSPRRDVIAAWRAELSRRLG
jgi:ArsR family transcriptional regulator